MARVKAVVLVVLCAGVMLRAQKPVPEFDVAVFRAVPADTPVKTPRGGPGTSDPGRITYASAVLRNILTRAFGVQSDQIVGPPWIDTEKYSIGATLPAATTQDDLRAMLQKLLADRIGLAVHHESRNLPVFVLAQAKGGPKLKPASAPDDGDAKVNEHFSRGPDGCPVLPTGYRGWDAWIDSQGVECDSYGAATMAELAHALAGLVKLGQGLRLSPHVIDRTGLEGEYDFKLRFMMQLMGPSALAAARSADGSASDPLGDNMSSLTRSLDQLGLSLRKASEPLDVIVIDKIQRVPVEN